MKRHCEKVRCADGSHVSVQASEYHYCRPRDNSGPYTHIEAGFPSVTPPVSWLAYIDGSESAATEAVYGYMPVALVWEFIDAHGGMVGGELPPGCER